MLTCNKTLKFAKILYDSTIAGTNLIILALGGGGQD